MRTNGRQRMYVTLKHLVLYYSFNFIVWTAETVPIIKSKNRYMSHSKNSTVKK